VRQLKTALARALAAEAEINFQAARQTAAAEYELRRGAPPEIAELHDEIEGLFQTHRHSIGEARARRLRAAQRACLDAQLEPLDDLPKRIAEIRAMISTIRE
jgi:hypothetical protein